VNLIFSNRYTLFGLTILLGFLAAVYYGWGLRPITVRDASPSLLREDFRADYVLMAAEVYGADHEVERAIGALGFLSKNQEGYNPLVFVSGAIEFAIDAGYSADDIELLQDLAAAIQTFDPSFAASPTP